MAPNSPYIVLIGKPWLPFPLLSWLPWSKQSAPQSPSLKTVKSSAKPRPPNAPLVTLGLQIAQSRSHLCTLRAHSRYCLYTWDPLVGVVWTVVGRTWGSPLKEYMTVAQTKSRRLDVLYIRGSPLRRHTADLPAAHVRFSFSNWRPSVRGSLRLRGEAFKHLVAQGAVCQHAQFGNLRCCLLAGLCFPIRSSATVVYNASKTGHKQSQELQSWCG